MSHPRHLNKNDLFTYWGERALQPPRIQVTRLQVPHLRESLEQGPVHHEATGKASGVRCTVFLVEETEAIKEHVRNHLRASDCLVSWWPSENEIYHVRSITCRLCYFKLK